MEGLVMLLKYLSYYKSKKVFVTGHTGFKGSWLVACLNRSGAIVKGYALLPEYDGLFTILKSINISESIFADIRDKKRLQEELFSFQPDFVFHLAAQPLVRRSYEIPAETFEVNVTGTANLLEAVTKLPNKCTIIIVTTDKVYQNREIDVLYKEDDRLGGYDPYSASKACTELVVDSFRNSFFNISFFGGHMKAIASARAGNVIGGGDWSKDRIVPDIIRSLKNNQELKIRNPYAVRPWQFVLEPVAGYLQLGVCLDSDPQAFSKAYNFGPEPEDHLTVKQLIELSIGFWGSGNWQDDSGGRKLHEAGLLKLDISLAKKELQWKPKLTAKQAIEWTVKWYKQEMQEQEDFTFSQIENYFSE